MEMTDMTGVFRNSFSISIDKRKEDIQRLVFLKENIPLPKIFPGYRNSSLSNIYRCSLSHESVIKAAKTMGLENCLIYEEDAYPRIDVMRYANMYLKEVPSDFDILIIGWIRLFNLPGKKVGMFNKFVPNKSTCYGANSYIVSERNYDRIIQEFEARDFKCADNFFEFAENVYTTEIPLFIQYSTGTSMHNHIGYVLDGDHKNPPKGFRRIEDYLRNTNAERTIP